MAINWNKINTPEKWQATAADLVAAARDAAKADDDRAMKGASSDLLDFLTNRTLDCPQEVADAVFGAQTELHKIMAEDIVGSIAGRTAQFNAYLEDIKRAGAKIKATAELISLTPVQNAIDEVRNIVTAVSKLRSDIQAEKNTTSLVATANTIASDLEAILKELEDLLPEE